MMKRAKLIYNPTSGREEIRRILPDLLQKLELGGVETSCYATTGEGDAISAVRQAVERKYDSVIAAGGDGTLHEIINGLAEQPNRPPLGILPLGTTNDFARALRIPKNWNNACEVILQQYTRPVDVGKANSKYFINIAGGGTLAELTYEVPSKLKTLIGQLAYYMKGLEMIPKLRPTKICIRAEGQEDIEEEAMLFLICNSNSVGGFEKLVPNADLNDGLFDCIVVRKCSLSEFIRIVTLTMRGEHLADPHVLHFQASSLQVMTPYSGQLNLDGEYGGILPCTFSILPSHLRIFVDEHGISSYK